MAQELLKVKRQLRSGAQIVGPELTRIEDQGQILDLESQNVHESFATEVAEWVGETDERQTRDAAVTSQLHETVQGTDEESIHRDLLFNKEIVRINEQDKLQLEHHEISIHLMRRELKPHQRRKRPKMVSS